MQEAWQKDVCGYIARLLRDSFGKGPESVSVSFGGTFMMIYLRNFLSPMEQILMEQDDLETVVTTRAKLMQKLIPEIKASVKMLTGVELQSVYYDWGLHNRSGMIFGIFPQSLDGCSVVEEYPGKEELHKEIDFVSYQAEKHPDEICSWQLNRKILVVVRNGILVAIERELIRLGYETELKYAKSNLEKRILHTNGHFESILQRRVVDLFVDWDFHQDTSVMVFALSETP